MTVNIPQVGNTYTGIKMSSSAEGQYQHYSQWLVINAATYSALFDNLNQLDYLLHSAEEHQERVLRHGQGGWTRRRSAARTESEETSGSGAVTTTATTTATKNWKLNRFIDQ